MRFLTLLFATCLMFAFSTSQAEARRGVGGTQQKLIFVSETKEQYNGAPVALCHLVETRNAFFVLNFFRSVESYVLAENNCATESFFTLDDTQFAALQAAGSVPADLPAQPQMSLASKIAGHWALGLILLVLAGFVYLKMKISKRKSERTKLMGDMHPMHRSVLDVMCHAAKADGSIDPQEVAEIQTIASKMLSADFDTQTVAQIAGLAETNLDQAGVKKLINSIPSDTYTDVMRGVLGVVASDGTFAGKEKQFVGLLATAMRMTQQEVTELLMEHVRKPA